MPKVVLEIEKEDLAQMYREYLSSFSFSYSPQCMELQQKAKEQRERIEKLVFPLVEDCFIRN